MYIHPILLLADKVLKGTEKLEPTEIAAMTLVGLLVVFAALMILVGFLYVTGGLFDKTFGKPKPQPTPPVKKVVAKPVQPKRSTPKPEAAAAAEEDEAVIAVIMAAIAAMSEADGQTYQIRSVRQVTRGGGRGRSAWAQAGINDATKPF